VPQTDVLLLPRVRRLAALVLAVAALLAVASTAFAADGSSGGATAESQAAPKAKKVTTKQIQKALGIKADGIAGPATLEALGLTGTTKNGSLESTKPVNPDDVAAVLAKIAECESGGNPAAVSPSGEYRGKYQFSQETWESLGGTGDPAEAEESVQDMYAAGLYQQRGLAPWPACSQQVQAQLDAATPAAGT
jgi:hypothetical protein